MFHVNAHDEGSSNRTLASMAEAKNNIRFGIAIDFTIGDTGPGAW